MSNHNINKFTLLLGKGVYFYKSMDDWEKFNETSLPEKEGFCSHLSMDEEKSVRKDFEIKKFGEYHDL